MFQAEKLPVMTKMNSGVVYDSCVRRAPDVSKQVSEYPVSVLRQLTCLQTQNDNLGKERQSEQEM